MAPCGLGTGTVPLLALLCRAPARCGVTAATTTSPPPCLPPGSPPGSPCLRLQLLGRCLATVQASCSWLMGKAFQFLASWSLHQFLLVTQGDLQVRAGPGWGHRGLSPTAGLGTGFGSLLFPLPPAAAEGRDGRAGAAGGCSLPGARGQPPAPRTPPAAPVSPGAVAVPADPLHGCQHPGRAEHCQRLLCHCHSPGCQQPPRTEPCGVSERSRSGEGGGLARQGAGLHSPSSPRSAPQQFAGDVLRMFSTDCKRMSAEIFDQTMPLGKHWRVSLRAGGWQAP